MFFFDMQQVSLLLWMFFISVMTRNWAPNKIVVKISNKKKQANKSRRNVVTTPTPTTTVTIKNMRGTLSLKIEQMLKGVKMSLNTN